MMVVHDEIELTLENFRDILKSEGYNLDVQDVMRSAIIDGVDLMPFLEECKNNPYRLDQIRLGKKEGIDEVFFSVHSGEGIYKIRQLQKKGVNLSTLEAHIRRGKLNEYALDKLIFWTGEGYNLTGLNLAIIPKSLFDVFEQGLEKGFNMKPFNDGRQYSADYIRYCLIIMSNRKPVDDLVGKTIWSEESIRVLAKNSRVLSDSKWSVLLHTINNNITPEKLSVLILCLKNDIDIGYFVEPKEHGDCFWSVDSLSLVVKAYESGLSWRKLVKVGPDEDSVQGLYNELKLAKSKKVGGRLLKG